jgi:hypothetical protein
MLWSGLGFLCLITVVCVILDKICQALDAQGKGRVISAYFTCNTRKLIVYNKKWHMPLQGKIVSKFLWWFIVKRNKWELI